MMKSTVNKLDDWHKTAKGFLAFGLLELIIAYIFASVAIDSGNLFHYFLTFLFVFGAGQNFFKLARKLINGKKR